MLKHWVTVCDACAERACPADVVQAFSGSDVVRRRLAQHDKLGCILIGGALAASAVVIVAVLVQAIASGADPGARLVIAVPTTIVLSLVLIGVLLWAKARRLRENLVTGTATVHGVKLHKQISTIEDRFTVWDVYAMLELPGQSPYRVIDRVAITEQAAARLVPGTVVGAKVHARDHSRFMLVFREPPKP